MLITQTPLRISFAGGGTDFQGYYRKDPRSPGCVVSTAIDKFVYVIVKERFDDKIYINYSQKEIVDNVDHIQHDLVREAMQKTEVYKGVEITTLADVPSEGSGLGSSSSLTVGLLNALYAYQGEQRTAEDLAREACQIEIDILKKPIGKQDQYIVAYGNLRMFKLVILQHYTPYDLAKSRLLLYIELCENVATVGAPNFGNYRVVDIVVKGVSGTTIFEPIATGPRARFLLTGRGGSLSFLVLRFQLTG